MEMIYTDILNDFFGVIVTRIRDTNLPTNIMGWIWIVFLVHLLNKAGSPKFGKGQLSLWMTLLQLI